MPQKIENLIYLIQADAGFALLKIADKAQSDAHSFCEFLLSQVCFLAQCLDLLAHSFHLPESISYRVYLCQKLSYLYLIGNIISYFIP